MKCSGNASFLHKTYFTQQRARLHWYFQGHPNPTWILAFLSQTIIWQRLAQWFPTGVPLTILRGAAR